MGFTTPFKDTVGKSEVPRRGSEGTYDNEPNFPGPGRTGGLLPEKTRDSHMSPKSPGWTSPDRPNIIWGK